MCVFTSVCWRFLVAMVLLAEFQSKQKFCQLHQFEWNVNWMGDANLKFRLWVLLWDMDDSGNDIFLFILSSSQVCLSRYNFAYPWRQISDILKKRSANKSSFEFPVTMFPPSSLESQGHFAIFCCLSSCLQSKILESVLVRSATVAHFHSIGWQLLSQR